MKTENKLIRDLVIVLTYTIIYLTYISAEFLICCLIMGWTFDFRIVLLLYIFYTTSAFIARTKKAEQEMRKDWNDDE